MSLCLAQTDRLAPLPIPIGDARHAYILDVDLQHRGKAEVPVRGSDHDAVGVRELSREDKAGVEKLASCEKGKALVQSLGIKRADVQMLEVELLDHIALLEQLEQPARDPQRP